MTKKYHYIGKETPRKDARDIVTGRANSFDHIKVPGMLFGKVLRSPHPHAEIKRIDCSRAKALKGVKANGGPIGGWTFPMPWTKALKASA